MGFIVVVSFSSNFELKPGTGLSSKDKGEHSASSYIIRKLNLSNQKPSSNLPAGFAYLFISEKNKGKSTDASKSLHLFM